jgi:hypothetical protein
VRVLLLGILGVMVVASPALASVTVRVPEPSTLVLVAAGGGVACAVALGRAVRSRRNDRRRGDH